MVGKNKKMHSGHAETAFPARDVDRKWDRFRKQAEKSI